MSEIFTINFLQQIWDHYENILGKKWIVMSKFGVFMRKFGVAEKYKTFLLILPT